MNPGYSSRDDWYPPPLHYGDDSGPVLSRRCSCGQVLSMPGLASNKASCRRCGDVEPKLLCFGRDLAEGITE